MLERGPGRTGCRQGELERIRVWFRDYKTPDGKPQNKFGFDDKCLDKCARALSTRLPQRTGRTRRALATTSAPCCGVQPRFAAAAAAAMRRAFTMKVIEETHGFWLALKSGRRANDEELSLH